MDALIHFFTNPIGAAIAGWVAFNFLALSLYKDDNEKTFALKSYAGEHWDNWLASFFLIPVLLFIGAKGLNITIDEKHLEWNDLYYVGSGFITEALKMAYKKWKSKQQIA